MNYVVGWGDFNVPIFLKHHLCTETGVSSSCSYKKDSFSQTNVCSFKRLFI